MAESYCLKAANFLSELCILILFLQSLYDILYANKNLTIKLLKIVIEYIYEKLILLRLDIKIQSTN